MEPLDIDNLPSDLEAERQVVGACLLSGQAVTAAMTALSPEDFFCNPYRWAFTAICEMAITGKPVNVQTVLRHLGEARTPDGKETLLGIMGGGHIITASIEGVLANEVDYWMGTVKKKKGERDLLAFAEQVRKVATSNPKDLARERAKLEEQLVTLSGDAMGSEVTAVSDGLEALEERIDRYIASPDSIAGMETGWASFDKVIDGFQPGNVTIVYAPSSRFKSFFAANIALRLGQRGHSGLWYPTEMPTWQVQERLVQLVAGLNFKWLRHDHEMRTHEMKIKASIHDMKALPIYFCESGTDATAIGAEVARQRKWNNIEYVIIDLIDHVSSSKYQDNEVSNQAQVMKRMKEIAKRNNLHVILITHIAKGDKSLRAAPDLDVEDMKGSSAKYQDVDVAISLMAVERDRETGEWKGLSRREISDLQHERAIIKVLVSITKNRHGEITRIPFAISLKTGGRMLPLDTRHPVQTTLPDTQAA